MYRFSRSIYRELAPRIDAEGVTGCRQPPGTRFWRRARRRCAAWRMTAATSRVPRRTLFSEIRDDFALADQVHVYMVIERYVDLAAEHLEQLPA